MEPSLNYASVLQDLGILAEDESIMKRVAKYLQRLVAEKKSKDASIMSKEEYFAKIELSKQQAKDGLVTVVHDESELDELLDSL